MSFIVGLWTVKAHLIAAIVKNNCSGRIWANTSSVVPSQLPRDFISCSHISCGADDPHFVTLDPLPFWKAGTSRCITVPSHFQAHTALRVERYHQERAVFTDLFLSFSFYYFGVVFWYFFHFVSGRKICFLCTCSLKCSDSVLKWP